MPQYFYTARDKEGKIVEGDTEVESEEQLARDLYSKGLLLTRASTKRSGLGTLNWRKMMQKLSTVSTMEKILLVRYLQVMLKAGLSLVKALGILTEQTNNPRLRYIIEDLRSNVEKGMAFNEALKRHPTVFSPLFVSIVKSGEVSGKLEKVLDELSLQMTKDRELVKKVIGAMIYPALILCAMVGIGLAMVIFILPQITEIFEEFEVDLPLMTRILISLGKTVGNHGLWLVLGLIVLVFASVRFLRSQTGRKILHPIYLLIPIFGNIVKKINIARFLRSFGSLLSSGLPILEALEVAAEAMGNRKYQETVKRSVEELRKGNTLGKTLGKSPRLFPPIVTQVIHVGEETGTTDTILDRLATFYEEDVDQTMKNLSAIVEPLLMLVIGGAVGIVAVSLILPIYRLSSVI